MRSPSATSIACSWRRDVRTSVMAIADQLQSPSNPAAVMIGDWRRMASENTWEYLRLRGAGASIQAIWHILPARRRRLAEKSVRDRDGYGAGTAAPAPLRTLSLMGKVQNFGLPPVPA